MQEAVAGVDREATPLADDVTMITIKGIETDAIDPAPLVEGGRMKTVRTCTGDAESAPSLDRERFLWGYAGSPHPRIFLHLGLTLDHWNDTSTHYYGDLTL